MASILPREPLAKIAFFENRNDAWTTNATSIGTTTAEVAALETKTATARDAYNAQQVLQAQAKAATRAYHEAVAEMTQAGTDIIKKIKAKAAVGGDSVYDLALIPPLSVPTPVRPDPRRPARPGHRLHRDPRPDRHPEPRLEVRQPARRGRHDLPGLPPTRVGRDPADHRRGRRPEVRRPDRPGRDRAGHVLDRRPPLDRRGPGPRAHGQVRRLRRRGRRDDRVGRLGRPQAGGVMKWGRGRRTRVSLPLPRPLLLREVPMLLTFQPRTTAHRRARVALPHAVAPVGTVRVTDVRTAPGEPTKAVWLFSAPVADPTGGVAGLVANGLPGLAWSREEDSSLFVEYAEAIESGGSWENDAGADGITGTDGAPLAAGSGVVDG